MGSANAADCNAASAACDLTDATQWAVCCYIPDCTDDHASTVGNDNTYTCAAGNMLITAAATTPQDATVSAADGMSATCCRAKVATDCAFATDMYCGGFSGTATNPCLAGTGATDACDTCPDQLNEPGTGFTAGSPAASCEDNICNALTIETAASKGIVIATLDVTAVTMTTLAAAPNGAVTAAAGWTLAAGMTNAGTVVAATCTGTATDTTATPNCATITAFIAPGGAGAILANCPAGCVYTPLASITCPAASGGDFVVAGAVGMTCTLPTTAPTGVEITGITCENLQTGSISCSVPFTCATTHHECVATVAGCTTGAVGIQTGAQVGMDTLAGNSDDGIKCLVDGAELVISHSETALAGLANGCNINVCVAAAVTDGYRSVGGTAATATTVLGISSADGSTIVLDCDAQAPPDYTVTSPDWFGTSAVTCADPTGAADQPFVYAGCSQAKCNDGATDDDGTVPGAAFLQSGCSVGMTLKADLATPCATATCTTTDCCSEDDGCAVIVNPGFDGVAGNADDGQGPCFGTDSTCVDVAAPGVGNTCQCDAGFFGADVTSDQALTTCSPTTPCAVQGSCTACTPIANSADLSMVTSVPSDMVTCAAADNSRAVACVTGAITVDNTANGVSDVCRLECPFTEVVALIDRLHVTTDACAVVDLTTGSPSEAAQTASCEAVAGCYYTPCVDQTGGGACGVNAGSDVIATCSPIYAACKAIAGGVAGTQADCAAGPKLSGVDTVLTSFNGQVSADDVAACTYSMGADGLAAGTDAADDTCLYTPPAADYDSTIVRCQALLDTNWAHDLRDSCDATQACPLHGAADAATPGLIAMVKLVYSGSGVAPDAAAYSAAWGSGFSACADATCASTNYFTDDGDANSKSFWDVCTGIRDAVLAAPTCSSGAGR